MDLWHQISFEIPELHSMLLFVAYSSFSPEVKIPAEVGITRLSGFSPPPSTRSPTCASTKTLRLHVHSLISYFWGKEILPEHFKQDYTLRNKRGGVGKRQRRRDKAGRACLFCCVRGILRKNLQPMMRNVRSRPSVWVCAQRTTAQKVATEQRCRRPTHRLRPQSLAE